ncbi:MAG: hypothetical protein AAF682_10190 [Planctomycetota bacterium]
MTIAVRNEVVLRPSSLKHFGPAEGSSFYLVTNSEYAPLVTIEEDAPYESFHVVTFDEGGSFGKLIKEKIPENTHILTILPKTLVESPTAEELGKRRKLSIMACSSGPTAWEAVQHFLDAGAATDPREHERISDRFFSLGEASERILFVDEKHGTTMEFRHNDGEYQWFEQLGMLEWGGQQVYPAGEISCFLQELYPDDLKADHLFAMNGTIALRGHPILHSGPPSFRMEDQARIYDRLAMMGDSAVIATVSGGRIEKLEPTGPRAADAAGMLEAMFSVDSRFGTLFEVGFSMNTHVKHYPGNTAMNEVCGFEHGSMHYGLGMLPFTQYHLDIICPDTSVRTESGEVLLGPPSAN